MDFRHIYVSYHPRYSTVYKIFRKGTRRDKNSHLVKQFLFVNLCRAKFSILLSALSLMMFSKTYYTCRKDDNFSFAAVGAGLLAVVVAVGDSLEACVVTSVVAGVVAVGERVVAGVVASVVASVVAVVAGVQAVGDGLESGVVASVVPGVVAVGESAEAEVMAVAAVAAVARQRLGRQLDSMRHLGGVLAVAACGEALD